MGDNEGSSFVPSGNSRWPADDGKKRIYELDPATGAPVVGRAVTHERATIHSGMPSFSSTSGEDAGERDER
jgi:hypothetical protein